MEWHQGFQLTVEKLARDPDYRAADVVTTGRELARDGVLDAHVVGAAVAAGHHDPQTLKRVDAQSVDTLPDGTVPCTFITHIDRPKIFRAALANAYDGWKEWYLGPRAADPGA